LLGVCGQASGKKRTYWAISSAEMGVLSLKRVDSAVRFEISFNEGESWKRAERLAPFFAAWPCLIQHGRLFGAISVQEKSDHYSPLASTVPGYACHEVYENVAENGKFCCADGGEWPK
jgi:hypothetical protein